jgi:hypothetical protein
MKATVYRTLGLALVLIALVAPGARAPGVGQPEWQPASACAATTDSAKTRPRSKPSSFAPRPRAANNAYGTPIQKPILKHRPKPKPQLKSQPLAQG